MTLEGERRRVATVLAAGLRRARGPPPRLRAGARPPPARASRRKTRPDGRRPPAPHPPPRPPPPPPPSPAHRTPPCRPRSRPTPSSGLRLLVPTHQLDWGGGQLFLVELLRQLTRQSGVSGLVLSPQDGPLAPLLEDLGFAVHVTSYPTNSPRAY